MSIDLEEYFQVSAFDSVVSRSEWENMESRVEESTHLILDLFDGQQVQATFFVLGWTAERHRALVREIFNRGHEVACHGYSHRLVYRQTPEEFRSETRKAKALLEDISGGPVVSYRAASYSVTRQSLWALEILAAEGFHYDSSIFPVVHDRYGIASAPRCPFRLRLRDGMELLEFPVSTVRLAGVNLPMAGGGYFRSLPYQLTRAAFRRLNVGEHLPVIFYLHPWEFDPEQPRQAVSGLTRFRHYLNLHRTEGRFSQLLRDFRFCPLRLRAETLRCETLTLQDLHSDSAASPGEAADCRTSHPE